MEQPVTGAAAVETPRASPSNFQDAMEARRSAEAGGGVPSSGYQQPRPGSAERAPQEIDPSKVEKRLDGSQGEPDEQFEGEEAPQEQVDDGPEAQRSQDLMTKILDALKHGVPVDHEALKDLPVTVNPDGDEQVVTFEQMRKGYMRHSTFTKGMQRAAQTEQRAQGMEQRANSILQAWNGLPQQWSNPGALIDGLESMGLEQAFDQAVVMYAKHEMEFARLPPQEQIRRKTEQAQSKANAQLARERQQFAQERQALLQRAQEQQASQGLDPTTQTFANQLSQLAPRAFKAAGLPNVPYSQQVFMKHLEVLHGMAGGSSVPLTADMCSDAAEAAREEIDFEQKRTSGKRKGNGQQGALGPRRMPGGAGPGVTNFTGKRARPSDFGGRFGSGGF